MWSVGVGVGVGVGPNEAHVDELAVQCVCAIKLAASVLELTNLGAGVHDSVFAVSPIDAPQVRLRAVEAQGQPLDVTARTIEFNLLNHGASIPHFARDEGAIELDPGARSSEGMFEPL